MSIDCCGTHRFAFGAYYGRKDLRMRYAFVWILLFTLLPFATAQKQPKHSREQTVFQLELPFEHPTPLPADVLQRLRADERNRQSFETCANRGKLKEIPAKWFVASEVSLKDDEPSGLVVKAENACLWGANIGPFWVFRRATEGYELVLNESALGLELLSTRTNGYRDIRLLASTAVVVLTRDYKFTNDKYALASKQVRPPRQWLDGNRY